MRLLVMVLMLVLSMILALKSEAIPSRVINGSDVNLHDDDLTSINHLFEKCIDGAVAPSMANYLNAKFLLEMYEHMCARTWNIDFIDFEARSGGNSIVLLATAIFQDSQLISSLSLNMDIVINFFRALQSRYTSAPYHNAAHAAAVAHSFYWILIATNQIDKLTPIQLFASIIACFGHDAGHPGLTSPYLIRTQSPRFIHYNDSVLENFHISELFRAANHTSNSDIFASLTPDEDRITRGIITDMILATDMSKHSELQRQIRARLIDTPADVLFNNDILSMLKFLIQLSDLSHFTKEYALHRRYNDLIIAEFYNQGDLELKAGVTPLPMMNRKEGKYTLGAHQTWFIAFIIKPFFTFAGTVLQGLYPLLAELEQNRLFWYNFKDAQRDE